MVKDSQTDVENTRYSLKTPNLRLNNFLSKRNFDTGFEISFVGTMDISLYTKSEQPKVERKYLRDLRKTAYNNPACGNGWQPLQRSLDS